MAKVKVNKDKCVGCGACVAIAPEVFELDSSGKSSVKVSEVEGDLLAKVKEAKSACPVGAIEVED